MNKITRDALISFRRERGEDAARYLARAALPQATESQRVVSLEKAVRAFEDCFDAHDELATGDHNPCTGLDRETVAQIKASIGDKAEKVYAAAEKEYP